MNGDKLSAYDFLGYLLPGAVIVLLVYHYAVLGRWPVVGTLGEGSLAATAFVVASFLAGHFIQAIVSGPVEEFFYFISGGKPSRKLSRTGLRDFSKEQWLEAKTRILIGCGCITDASKAKGFQDEEAVRVALQRSRKLGEVERFNGLAALNRALLGAVIVGWVVSLTQSIATWQIAHNLLPITFWSALLLVQVSRFRQRGEYLVIEAIYQADLAVSSKSPVSGEEE